MKAILNSMFVLCLLGTGQIRAQDSMSESSENKRDLKNVFKSKAFEMELPYEHSTSSSNSSLNSLQTGKNFQTKGLLQFYFVDSDESKSQLKWRRGELALTGDLTDITSFFAMVDISKRDASILQDLGFTLKVLNQKVVIGQFRRPTSLEALQSTGTLELLERAIVVQTLAFKRDVGAMVTGEVAAFKLQYMVGIFNGEGPNASDTNEKKDVAAMVIWKPLDQMQVYASVYDGSQSVSNLEQNRWGVGGRTQWGPVVLKIEYLTAHDGAVEKDGWYALASYTPNFGDIEVLNPLRLTARYEEWDANKDDSSEIHVWTLGAHYFLDPKEVTKVGVDLFYQDGKGREKDDYGLSAGYQGKF